MGIFIVLDSPLYIKHINGLVSTIKNVDLRSPPMTQPTMNWTSQQRAARDAMSAVDPGPGITSRNELDDTAGRGMPLAMQPGRLP